jgi:hypothetical protein
VPQVQRVRRAAREGQRTRTGHTVLDEPRHHQQRPDSRRQRDGIGQGDAAHDEQGDADHRGDVAAESLENARVLHLHDGEDHPGHERVRNDGKRPDQPQIRVRERDSMDERQGHRDQRNGR